MDNIDETDEMDVKFEDVTVVVPEEKGPNGGPVVILPNGDKAEWIVDGDEGGFEWPLILLRGVRHIVEAEEEYVKKSWWGAFRGFLTFEEDVTEIRNSKEMEEIEAEYGLDDLPQTDFEWGMVKGKLSALRWVLGSDWNDFDL